MTEDPTRPARYELRQSPDKSWVIHDVIEDRPVERKGLVFVGLDWVDALECLKLLEGERRLN